MSIITLTTDFGLKDHYVGALKGNIIRQFEQAKIVDISHQIEKHNIVEAAFVLRNAFIEFPKGSIHLIGVMSESTNTNRHIALEYKDHFFVGTDNGIFSLLLEEPATRMVELSIGSDSPKETFVSKDLLTKAACHLARGGTLEVIGNPIDELVHKGNYVPIQEANEIRGSVIYVDSYGNAITNITESIFESVGRGRDFDISTKVAGYNMQVIRRNYSETPKGERLAIFGANGHLEIALNEGNASKLMNMKFGDVVRVEFKD